MATKKSKAIISRKDSAIYLTGYSEKELRNLSSECRLLLAYFNYRSQSDEYKENGGWRISYDRLANEMAMPKTTVAQRLDVLINHHYIGKLKEDFSANKYYIIDETRTYTDAKSRTCTDAKTRTYANANGHSENAQIEQTFTDAKTRTSANAKIGSNDLEHNELSIRKNQEFGTQIGVHVRTHNNNKNNKDNNKNNKEKDNNKELINKIEEITNKIEKIIERIIVIENRMNNNNDNVFQKNVVLDNKGNNKIQVIECDETDISFSNNCANAFGSVCLGDNIEDDSKELEDVNYVNCANAADGVCFKVKTDIDENEHSKELEETQDEEYAGFECCNEYGIQQEALMAEPCSTKFMEENMYTVSVGLDNTKDLEEKHESGDAKDLEEYNEETHCANAADGVCLNKEVEDDSKELDIEQAIAKAEQRKSAEPNKAPTAVQTNTAGYADKFEKILIGLANQECANIQELTEAHAMAVEKAKQYLPLCKEAAERCIRRLNIVLEDRTYKINENSANGVSLNDNTEEPKESDKEQEVEQAEPCNTKEQEFDFKSGNAELDHCVFMLRCTKSGISTRKMALRDASRILRQCKRNMQVVEYRKYYDFLLHEYNSVKAAEASVSKN